MFLNLLSPAFLAGTLALELRPLFLPPHPLSFSCLPSPPEPTQAPPASLQDDAHRLMEEISAISELNCFVVWRIFHLPEFSSLHSTLLSTRFPPPATLLFPLATMSLLMNASIPTNMSAASTEAPFTKKKKRPVAAAEEGEGEERGIAWEKPSKPQIKTIFVFNGLLSPSPFLTAFHTAVKLVCAQEGRNEGRTEPTFLG